MLPVNIGVNFALAAAEKDVQLTRSLEGLAMDALKKSSLIKDTKLG